MSPVHNHCFLYIVDLGGPMGFVGQWLVMVLLLGGILSNGLQTLQNWQQWNDRLLFEWRRSYDGLVCGRKAAAVKNLAQARSFWLEHLSAPLVEPAYQEAKEELQDYFSFYPPADCAAFRLQLYREHNPEIDPEYPNWVVRVGW